MWRLAGYLCRRLDGIIIASLMLPLWGMAGTNSAVPPNAFVLSMVGTLGAAAMSLLYSTRREFIYLPLSRRQRWRARWLVSTGMPVSLMALAKIIALNGTAHMTTALLSTLFDVAYTQGCLGLLVLVNADQLNARAGGTDGPKSTRWLARLAALAFIAEVIAPFALATHLPTRWRDVTPSVWLAASVAMALGVMAFNHAPLVAGSSRRHVGAVRDDRHAADHAIDGPRVPWIGALMRPYVKFGLFNAVVLIGSNLSDTLTSNFHQTLWIICGVTWLQAFSGIRATPAWPDVRSTLRQLRTLPLASRMLAAMIMAEPLVVVSVMWVAYRLTQLTFPARFAAFSVNMFACLICIQGFAVGFSLRRRPVWVRRTWMWGGLGVITLVRYASHRAEVQPLLALPGVPTLVAMGSVAIGTWLAFRTITRDHSAYAPVPPLFPYGVQGPQR